ncbi:MAG: glutamate synthase subunit beta [Candidatus Hydrogenedentes bacterium]|nr:glutamate synthase subunit beta [Candidatus Hydrogenedentota bacterium]
MFPNKERGFMSFDRVSPTREATDDRIAHYQEFDERLSTDELRKQSYRCMNCGVPFCHDGCPLGNVIPDFNEHVKDNDWRGALEILHSTNNFPEFTGRVCPAPCETSCVLAINKPAVTIKLIERAIGDFGWEEGYIVPQKPIERTGKKVAVVGSGPAGLAAAQQLNRAGHTVTVYERDDEPGGLLMYGIPDFKLEKSLVHRRLDQMREEGVIFVCDCEIGRDMPAQQLVDEFDAVLLTIGSTQARTLPIPGADLDGVHMAMEFLPQQNRRIAGKEVPGGGITATGKAVVILGGGDTGSDCHGTSIRQGAKSIRSIELLPQPPVGTNERTPWPDWPLILRTSSSHEEGGERDWSMQTKEFVGTGGKLTGIRAVRLEWGDLDGNGRSTMGEVPGSEFILPADLVLLAMGFVHPEPAISEELGLELDERQNIKAVYGIDSNAYKTSHDKVWVAGDARRGQSLVVWAIHEGREAARVIDTSLMGRSDLSSAHSFGYDQSPVS